MLSTTPSIALLMPPLLNSRALILIIDVYESVTHMLVSQIPNNANSNINPLLLSILDTAVPIRDNIICLLPR